MLYFKILITIMSKKTYVKHSTRNVKKNIRKCYRHKSSNNMKKKIRYLFVLLYHFQTGTIMAIKLHNISSVTRIV